MDHKPEIVGTLLALSALVLLYSLVIAQQILLGVVIVAMMWSLSLLYILIVRLGRIATALERLVDQRLDEEDNLD